MTKNIFLAMSALVLLTTCAPATKTVDGFGNDAFVIECNWSLDTVCYNKAVKVCPNGYYTIDKKMDGGLFPINKYIVVRCKQ